jgi:diguanylate cyclase (GGDEF)-like protein
VSRPPNGRFRLALGAAGLLTAVFAVVVVVQPGSPQLTLVVDDVGEAVAALWAAIACATAAGRSAARQRLAWSALSAGCAAWTFGEVVWSVDEVVLHRAPFPSVADVGFLLFPVLASAALLLLGERLGARQRLRELVDGLLAAIGLFIASWVTVLQPIVATADLTPVALVTSLAYPATDIVVMALLLLALSRVPAEGRLPLRLLATGLACLAISDSAFAYLTASGEFGAGNALDVGWFAGFALIAVAATAITGAEGRGNVEPVASIRRDLLPSAPLVLTAAVLGYSQVAGRALGHTVGIAVGVLAVLMVTRQVLAMSESVRLMGAVRAREDELRWRAFHDPLTGLANRDLLRDRTEHALERAGSGAPLPALVFVDLDDFKHVNDRFGHAAGDALLLAVAERLTQCVRRGDSVARLGGDEFAVLVEPATAVDVVSERVLAALDEPFDIAGSGPTRVTGSIGIAVAGPDDRADELLAAADVAMYTAKRDGKARLSRYEPGMRLAGQDDAALRADLTAAVAHREISVAYQPVVDLQDGRVVGLEALARWAHPEHGAVPPGIFIPLAERHGLIQSLDSLVLDLACEQLARWDTQLKTRPTLAVNVSAAYLTDPALPEHVAASLRRHQLAPERLILEITESALLNDVESAVTVVQRLKRLGVGIAIDDFGTGWSSLAYLHRFPVDSLKVDRSFIADLSGDGARIVSVIVQIAQTLGLATVAEGLERVDQAPLLREIGCDFAQGYALGVPTTASQVLPVLRRARVRGVRPVTLPEPRPADVVGRARSGA